jgi:hypothetical protein
MTDKFLKKIYFKPTLPGGFAGPDKLNKLVQ